MREFREGDELPFPEFDEETRRGLMDRMEDPGKRLCRARWETELTARRTRCP